VIGSVTEYVMQSSPCPTLVKTLDHEPRRSSNRSPAQLVRSILSTMDILAFLNNHKHYWGIPHARDIDSRIVQTCYECGSEREVKIDLRPSPFLDPTSKEREHIKAA